MDGRAASSVLERCLGAKQCIAVDGDCHHLDMWAHLRKFLTPPAFREKLSANMSRSVMTLKPFLGHLARSRCSRVCLMPWPQLIPVHKEEHGAWPRIRCASIFAGGSCAACTRPSHVHWCKLDGRLPCALRRWPSATIYDCGLRVVPVLA